MNLAAPASTPASIESDPSRETGATLGHALSPAIRESVSRRRPSLIRAVTIASILPFARTEELGGGQRYIYWAESPYIALEQDDEDVCLQPFLRFTLGASPIAIPKRVVLSPAALRALAPGQVIFGPLTLEFEELG